MSKEKRGHLLLCLLLVHCSLLSCTRPAEKEAEAAPAEVDPDVTDVIDVQPTIPPMALLQAGENPLWFQFGDKGPVLLDAIEDACFSAALIPWPLAPHIRFILAQGKDLMMAVNGDGFIRFAPWKRQGAEMVGLYRIPGGDSWRQYTLSAFILFNEQPAALLYRDDRFYDSKASLPSPRLWTFDLFSSAPGVLPMPALDALIAEEGWDFDTLRRGGDGHWYFRAVKKTAQPEIRMLRSADLVQTGEQVSLGTFQNAALPEPLSAAPSPLKDLLEAALNSSGCGIAAVVSPEFQSIRSFAVDRGKPVLSAFYSEDSGGEVFLLAIQPRGTALYLETENSVPTVRRFSLPPLPDGFVYTGVGVVDSMLVAAWEEQEGYSIGAAGFMVIRL